MRMEGGFEINYIKGKMPKQNNDLDGTIRIVQTQKL